MLSIVAAAAVLCGIGAWIMWRRSPQRVAAPRARAPSAPPEPQSAGGVGEAGAAVDFERLEAAAAAAAERLWRLAFAAPSQAQASDLVHRRVRANITAILEVDTLDPRYFPRRPALLPQLLQAVNDPRTASDKLSRIIAHDPVLTGDVLRLANSSLYRVTPAPIETIQRAIVVCGVDALRGMLAAAMLQPAFRATRKNFPRLPRMLWERTERAARAAELYALEVQPQDRFESQLVVLLGALGPLAVYGAALDVYARNPHFAPSGDLCVELIVELAPHVSLQIARDWGTSERLLAALEGARTETLTAARRVGEFFGTLSYLESQTVLTREQRLESIDQSGMPRDLSQKLWAGLTGNA